MSADPYVYEGTDVLRNTADLRDPQALAEREMFVSLRALKQLQKEPVLGAFDLAHYAAIHKRLFGEIYPWAGETRTIDLWKPEIVLQGKSVAYSPPTAIESQAQSALDRLRQPPGDLKQDRPTVAYAQAFAALWQAHPFREGNTRTLLAFMEQHARHHRQPLDQGLINRVPSETRDALVLATRGQLRPFSQMIQNARYSDEQRAYPLVGRLSADASEVMRLMGSPRLVVPEPGTRVQGQVVALSYQHALVREARVVQAVPLSAFQTPPQNNARVDVRVLAEGAALAPQAPREEAARAEVTASVLIPASQSIAAGQNPNAVERNRIEIPGPSAALSEALKTRSPAEIAADLPLAVRNRLSGEIDGAVVKWPLRGSRTSQAAQNSAQLRISGKPRALRNARSPPKR